MQSNEQNVVEMVMNEKTKTRISIILLVCGIILMCTGVFNGELKTVYQKATNICLECIGIG